MMYVFHHMTDYNIKFCSFTTAFAQRTGPAVRVSLRRDRPGELTLPALHACGSASPLSVRTNVSLENIGRIMTPITLHVLFAAPRHDSVFVPVQAVAM
jgi:hypothetical protein